MTARGAVMTFFIALLLMLVPCINQSNETALTQARSKIAALESQLQTAQKDLLAAQEQSEEHVRIMGQAVVVFDGLQSEAKTAKKKLATMRTAHGKLVAKYNKARAQIAGLRDSKKLMAADLVYLRGQLKTARAIARRQAA